MRRRLLTLIAALVVLVAPALAGGQGTTMPFVSEQFFDNNGDPCSGCLLYAYAAGTTTAQDTYLDISLTTPNQNPIELDSAGRPNTGYVYLSATSYRFVLMDASASTTYWEADNTPAVPATGLGLDVSNQIAGENIAAGEVVYMASGCCGPAAGRWFRTDAGTLFASSLATVIGVAPTAIENGAVGSIRIGGRVTSLSGLTAGLDYYVSATAGELVATAPTNARFVGRAESTSTIILNATPTVASIITQAMRVNAATPYTLTWPAAAAAGVLKSDGAGVLSIASSGTLLSKTTTYTVAVADGDDVVIAADATAGAFTVNFYTAVGNAGRKITVKKTDSSANVVTLDPNAAETVDLAATWAVAKQNEAVTVVSDNANWRLVSRAPPSWLGAEGRLTISTGTPVPIADVSASANIYYTPYTGTRIALYDGTATWNVRTFAELTISLSGCTISKPYDVFLYDNAGVVTAETLVWTNTTTRATALVRQDGVWVKTGATTRRYVGSFFCNATGGLTDDTAKKRYLYNANNRVRRPVLVTETTDNWTYSTAAWHQANAAAANQVEVMAGLAESLITLRVHHTGSSNGGAVNYLQGGIGEDGTTALATGCLVMTIAVANSIQAPSMASLDKIVAVGVHNYPWIEYASVGGNTGTFFGDNGQPTIQQNGLTGSFED